VIQYHLTFEDEEKQEVEEEITEKVSYFDALLGPKRQENTSSSSMWRST